MGVFWSAMKLTIILTLTFGWLCKRIYCNCDGEHMPIVLVHGGAGDIDPGTATKLLRGVKLAARIGYKTLDEGGSVLDAVEAAIRSMEIDDDFNAGYGSVLTFDGTIENDACIMDGKNLSAGCVSLISDILHPITVAKKVLEKLPHTYMAGLGAMKFAKDQGIEILPPGMLITDSSRKQLETYKRNVGSGGFPSEYKIGGETVGAVAIDACGNFAAGTSTGGVIGKLAGCVGDASLIGSGIYADNKIGAISVSGSGENIMRYNVAQRIMQRINYQSSTAQDAVEDVLDMMIEHLEATAGAILIDKFGAIGIYFTTKTMPWAYQKERSMNFGIFKGENIYEYLNE